MASASIVGIAFAVICLLFICPMSAQPDITGQVTQEINDRIDEWLEFYGNRDFEALCNELYTEDCVINLPGAITARGREGCVRGWGAIKEEDYQEAEFSNPIIEEVIVTSADYVIEHGDVTNTVGQNLKYMLVWKRIEGKLYIFHNINNLDSPYKAPTLLEEITDRSNELSYYFHAGDFESACNVYTPDCWIAPQGSPPVSGRDGCKRLMVKTAISGASVSAIPEQYETSDLGDGYILCHGAWIMYDEAGGELDRGKDMMIWKRMEDGQPYVYFDMWNSDIHF